MFRSVIPRSRPLVTAPTPSRIYASRPPARTRPVPSQRRHRRVLPLMTPALARHSGPASKRDPTDAPLNHPARDTAPSACYMPPAALNGRVACLIPDESPPHQTKVHLPRPGLAPHLLKEQVPKRAASTARERVWLNGSSVRLLKATCRNRIMTMPLPTQVRLRIRGTS